MIRRLLAVAAAVLATVLLGGSGETGPAVVPAPTARQAHDRVDVEPTPGRVEVLMARHHCWSGAAPTDVSLPSRAVVSLPGEEARVVPADVGFGIWLDGDPGVLHGFCR